MKIIGLSVNNFRKLTGCKMEFSDKGITFIKGDNEQGKSSVIDSLYFALKGNRVLNDDIVKHGKDKMIIKVKLDELTIERIKTKKSSKLKITAKDGTKIQNGQAILDTLFNELTFNPFPFLNKTAKEKFKFVMDLLDINVDDIDDEIKEMMDERRMTGREQKALGEPEDEPKLQNEKELKEQLSQVNVELSEAVDKKNEFEDWQNDVDGWDRSIISAEDEVEEIKEEQRKLAEKLKDAKQLLNTAKEQYERLTTNKPELVNDEQIKIVADKRDKLLTEIGKIDSHNAAAKQIKQRNEKRKEVSKEYETLTKQIEKLRNAKKEKFQQADLGIKGLEVREDGLYYNGIFSENWSDSQGIRISLELCYQQNPELKAIFVDRGESFGKKRLEELEKWAEEKDIQVIMTQVANEIPDNIPDNVFYIEEGQIINKQEDWI